MGKQSVVEKIKALCKENKTSIAAIERELGFGNGSIRKWDDASPAYERISAVANFLGVTVSDLTGDAKKAPAQTGERKISDEDMMFALWGDTTDVDKDDLDDVKRYAAFIRERKKKK